MSGCVITGHVGSQQQRSSLLGRLLQRGDSIRIELGRLIIEPASGESVPPEWLAKHGLGLTRSILAAVGQDAYFYLSHKTGRYGRTKAAGLTLQFESVLGLAEAYTIFNVDLSRARSTEAGARGTPLPAGKFRPSAGGHLSKFWQSTGLPLRRSTAMCDYMGNLRGILFSGILTGSRNDGRLDSGSLRALSIPASVISQAVLSDNPRTDAEHDADSVRTSVADKDSFTAQQLRTLEPSNSTCEKGHDKTVIRERGYMVSTMSFPVRKSPQEQTEDEWLADYNSADASP